MNTTKPTHVSPHRLVTAPPWGSLSIPEHLPLWHVPPHGITVACTRYSLVTSSQCMAGSQKHLPVRTLMVKPQHGTHHPHQTLGLPATPHSPCPVPCQGSLWPPSHVQLQRAQACSKGHPDGELIFTLSWEVLLVFSPPVETVEAGGTEKA